MSGWMDKLKDKAQQTLQDPQKMDAIKSKVAGTVGRRLAGGSGQGSYYGPGINPGMVVVEDSAVTGYGGGDDSGGDVPYGDASGSESSTAPGQESWTESATSDSGTWDTGSTADTGGWDGGSSNGGDGGDW